MPEKTVQALEILNLAKKIAVSQKAKEVDSEHLLAAVLVRENELLREITKLDQIKPLKQIQGYIKAQSRYDRLVARDKMDITTGLGKIIGSENSAIASLVAERNLSEINEAAIVIALLLSGDPLIGKWLEANGIEDKTIRQRINKYWGKSKDFLAIDLEMKLLHQAITKNYIGQERAVTQLINAYRVKKHYNRQDTNTSGTPHIIVVIGDGRSGKSFLAESFIGGLRANKLDQAVFEINMATYTNDHMSADIIGSNGQNAPPRAGRLTSYVQKHPETILVLDNFNMAHPAVMNAVMPCFSNRLKDSQTGNIVDFSRVFILVTIRGVGDLAQQEQVYGFYQSGIPRGILKKELKKILQPLMEIPEVLVRERLPVVNDLMDNIAEVIYLSRYSFADLVKITKSVLEGVSLLARQNYEADIVAGDDAGKLRMVSLILANLGKDVFPASMKEYADEKIGSPIREWFCQNPEAFGSVSQIEMVVNDEEDILNFKKRRPTVFHVDDDPKYHEMLKKATPSLSYILSSTADKAMQEFESCRNEIDMVLLDLNLVAKEVIPSHDELGNIHPHVRPALNFLKTLRKMHPAVPVYIHSTLLSENVSPLHAQFVKIGGANGYFPKINPHDLRQKRAVAEALTDSAENILWKKHMASLHRKGQEIHFETSVVKTGTKLILRYDHLQFVSNPVIEDSQWFRVTKPDTSFKDLIGVEEIRERLLEAVHYLQDPSGYVAAGVKVNRGFLLYGPPGTGKTSIAKALAHESGALFIPLKGTDFQSKYVGDAEKKIKSLFDTARRYQPVVIFIDEMDSIGSRDQYSAAHPWIRDVINALLAEIDGFETSEGIVYIGATNHINQIDEALKRPGRFGVHLELALPENLEDIEKILALALTEAKDHNPAEKAKVYAKQVSGLSPADIRFIIHEAKRAAYKNNAGIITAEHFNEARNRHLMGDVKKITQTQQEIEKTALHEAGHTLMAVLCGVDFHQVTINPRKQALGFVEPVRNRLSNIRDVQTRIDICLAGRAAEAVRGGDNISPGCASDLQQATDLAAAMLFRWGMRGDLGLAAISDSYSTDELIKQPHLWEKVQEVLKERENCTADFIKKNEDLLYRIQKELIAHKTLLSEQVKMICKQQELNRQ